MGYRIIEGQMDKRPNGTITAKRVPGTGRFVLIDDDANFVGIYQSSAEAAKAIFPEKQRRVNLALAEWFGAK